MYRELYLDGEWFIGGKLFLLGYCYEKGKVVQLHHRVLSKISVLKMLDKLDTNGRVYFYGPDIGVLEKYFDINIRNRFICVNLLRVFRLYMPRSKSFKLGHFEVKFGIVRKRKEYKKNIFEIFNDWKSYKWRKFVLQYNYEDVENLRVLKKKVFLKYKIRITAKDAMK